MGEIQGKICSNLAFPEQEWEAESYVNKDSEGREGVPSHMGTPALALTWLHFRLCCHLCLVLPRHRRLVSNARVAAGASSPRERWARPKLFGRRGLHFKGKERAYLAPTSETITKTQTQLASGATQAQSCFSPERGEGLMSTQTGSMNDFLEEGASQFTSFWKEEENLEERRHSYLSPPTSNLNSFASTWWDRCSLFHNPLLFNSVLPSAEPDKDDPFTLYPHSTMMILYIRFTSLWKDFERIFHVSYNCVACLGPLWLPEGCHNEMGTRSWNLPVAVTWKVWKEQPWHFSTKKAERKRVKTLAEQKSVNASPMIWT